jgi:hypothetical protein
MSKQIHVGDRVRLTVVPAYFKTAEPMPMLRPASIVAVGEEGIVTDHRPGNYWCVKFGAGSFLVEKDYIEVV